MERLGEASEQVSPPFHSVILFGSQSGGLGVKTAAAVESGGRYGARALAKKECSPTGPLFFHFSGLLALATLQSLFDGFKSW